jgi:DNA-binding LytR/AlgR family response regulator
LRILVVDDEKLARGRLIRMLERIPDVAVVGEADSGAAALAQIKKLKPGLVLLDVQMPGLDGLALAEKPGMPPIVFTTAHLQFAADAFDLDAVDYLVKPVRQDRLEVALERVRRRETPATASAEAYQIAVHGPGKVRFVDVRQVVAFRALDKYTEFAIGGEQLLVRESLEALLERFAGLGFVRVHRAALVRRDAIVELVSAAEGLLVRLTEGSAVVVSHRQAAALRRRLGLRA